MKLLLENWRKYAQRRNDAARILDNIQSESIVKMKNGLFVYISSGIFVPLTHVDVGAQDGLSYRSARDWDGGRIYIKRTEMLDMLEKDPTSINTVLGPAEAKQITNQFGILQKQIKKDYIDRGIWGSLFDGEGEFKRNYMVDIDLNNLKVTLS